MVWELIEKKAKNILISWVHSLCMMIPKWIIDSVINSLLPKFVIEFRMESGMQMRVEELVEI
jgi:hypothetical protein